jgi:hypothetical protein
VKGNQHLHIHRGSLGTKGDTVRGHNVRGGVCNARLRQDERYSYRYFAAAARTALPSACTTALPKSDVVDETQLVNRAKHPMRVSKISAYRSVERGWGNKSKG